MNRTNAGILRVFRATINPGKHEAFERNVREHSIPLMEAQHVPYYFGRPIDGAEDEFVVISVWRDIESLRKFAGDSLEPVIPFEDESIFASISAQHYELMSD